jgi:PadR family transcriptional regulator PadR
MLRMVRGDALNFMTQMRRGSIEFCVLALLRDEERYGLDLSRTLADSGIVSSEGTMYPLLARLRQGELVETSWHESTQGPPRRYYRLTADGRTALNAFTAQWQQFRDAVDSLLDGGRTS